jgi:hypothetical protein
MVVWNGANDNGRFIDQAFPPEIRKATRSQEMQIELKNGAMWQLCGSDNYDRLVGTNPFGIVFSEWSLCDPAAWDRMRPILSARKNNGWAIFIYTARGKNHGWSMSEMAKNNPLWHHSLLTVDDTKDDEGYPIHTPEAIQEEVDAGMSEEKKMQDYYCSFDMPIPGAYFAEALAAARKDKRICFIPIEPQLRVHTFWDLGISKGNSMVIWFVQALGKEIRVINHIENEGKDMSWYIQQVEDFAKEHNISYGEHHAPHDIGVRDLMSGKKRIDTAKEMGINFRMVDRTNDLNDSIELTRKLFPRCWFDETRCERGLSALESYHRKYDSARECYMDKPEHDWASNSADAFRQMAQAWNDRLALTKRPSYAPVVAKHDFSVF